MLLTNYASAMEFWKGRIDSTTDYDAFRWHQWVQPLNLNEENTPFEGTLGFAFIGFCSEQGVKRNKGRVGTALAPEFIRKQMANLPCTFTQDVKMYDAGDILCDEIPMEDGQRQLGLAVQRILELGLFPIVLGGGHETTFGHFQGQYHYLRGQKILDQDSEITMSAAEESANLGIVNFDAHFDMRPYNQGSSSGSMFRQIADICQLDGEKYHYMPLGIQKHSNTVQLFKTAKELGVDYIIARDLLKADYAYILEKLDNFLYNCDNAYVTICTDVFSSAFAPGVSAAQSLGVDPEIALPILKHILRTRKVRGFDICEISPRFDQDNTTANLGAVIIFTVVATLSRLNGLSVQPDDGEWA